MDGLALTLVISGLWFTYAGVTNRAPIRTLLSVIKDPGNARAIVHNKELKIDPNVVDTVTAGSATNPIFPYGSSSTGLQAVPVSGTPDSSGNPAAIVAFARSQIGKPYIFGGLGDPGWDCSGLVKKALETVNVSVSHSALAQLTSTKGKIIPANIKDLSQLQPGDIIFPAAAPEVLGNHVAIYSGNGNIIEAAFSGSNVRERAIYPFLVAKRFTK
jgi:cell wall-associated NlpC family hydrolase